MFPGSGIGTGPSLGPFILLTTHKDEEEVLLFFLFIQLKKKSYSLYIGGSRKVNLKIFPTRWVYHTKST